MDIRIINAEEKDIPLILSFIKEIAEYEKLSDEVIATEQSLRQSLFSNKPNAEVIFAYLDNIPIAYAVYFYNFSTFLGKKGLYLEDIFVKPEFRSKGIGKKLFLYLVELAVKNNCGRFEWAVLNWNESAIQFYKKFGAEPLTEWTTFRLSENNMKEILEKR
ncbi:MAG: GNAT family N-acetyltransferase [Ignavibacterium sp.]